MTKQDCRAKLMEALVLVCAVRHQNVVLIAEGGLYHAVSGAEGDLIKAIELLKGEVEQETEKEEIPF